MEEFLGKSSVNEYVGLLTFQTVRISEHRKAFDNKTPENYNPSWHL